MPREPGRDLRQEAERKVEQRFAQQSEALFASHKEQRERDLRAQQQAVERVAQEQARIADNKRQAARTARAQMGPDARPHRL